MSQPFEAPDPGPLGELLRSYRARNGIDQADLAQILHLDRSRLAEIETGRRPVREPDTLLRIAEWLGIAAPLLDRVADLPGPTAPDTSVLVGPVDPVGDSQAGWRATRRGLNRARGPLARTAIRLYRPDLGLGDVPLMARPEWLPDAPIHLDDLELEWTDETAPGPVRGVEPEAAGVLPLRAPGRRFTRYTSAIRHLDPPALFQDNPGYRLLDVDFSGSSGRMTFGLATYFDKLDLAEALAHELAAARTGTAGTAPWSALPLRALVGDPFELRRRVVVPDIQTLTLRRERSTGQATFLLHWRDPTKVATTGGVYGLIPTGEFQPSGLASRHRVDDFDLWRSTVREYAEEILGEPERPGSREAAADHEDQDLDRTLGRARDAGRVRVFCLGVGLDALTLAASILTVAVFDDDVFDEVFADAVRINAEGVLVFASDTATVSEGLPFTAQTVRRLLRDQPISSPGACVLDRAWRFRDIILVR